MSTHIVPRSVFVTVAAALMLLLALTMLVPRYDLGSWNIVLALGIALVKAALVVLIFMEVRWGSRLVWFFAGIGVLWLVILISITLSDYHNRIPIHPGA